jgi:hypothetical protein
MATETGIEPNTVRQFDGRALRFSKEEMGEMIARISRSRHNATEPQDRDHDRDIFTDPRAVEPRL